MDRTYCTEVEDHFRRARNWITPPAGRSMRP